MANVLIAIWATATLSHFQLSFANTPMCVIGTKNIQQPSGGSGKCYCNFPWDSGHLSGYCEPDPYDEGLSNHLCTRDADDVEGRCGYYCVCGAAMASNSKADITCCYPSMTMGLKNRTIVDKSEISGSAATSAPVSYVMEIFRDVACTELNPAQPSMTFTEVSGIANCFFGTQKQYIGDTRDLPVAYFALTTTETAHNVGVFEDQCIGEPVAEVLTEGLNKPEVADFFNGACTVFPGSNQWGNGIWAKFTTRVPYADGSITASWDLKPESSTKAAELQVCADKTKFTPNTKMGDDDNAAPCSYANYMIQPFIPTEETCLEEVMMGEANMSRAAALSYFSSMCCSGTPSVCAQFEPQICADPNKYVPSAKNSDADDSGICLFVSAMLPPFSASEEACEQMILMGDQNVSLTAITTRFAVNCCGGTPGACAPYEFQYCADGDAWSGASQFTFNGEAIPCAAVAAGISKFIPDEMTCSEEIIVDPEIPPVVRSEVLSMVAAGCCGGNPSICDDLTASKKEGSSKKTKTRSKKGRTSKKAKKTKSATKSKKSKRAKKSKKGKKS